MDKVEAYELIQSKIEEYQSKPFAILAKSAGSVDTINVQTDNAVTYQLEIKIDWVDAYQDSVIIEVVITDLNWFKFEPLSEKVVITR